MNTALIRTNVSGSGLLNEEQCEDWVLINYRRCVVTPDEICSFVFETKVAPGDGAGDDAEVFHV